MFEKIYPCKFLGELKRDTYINITTYSVSGVEMF